MLILRLVLLRLLSFILREAAPILLALSFALLGKALKAFCVVAGVALSMAVLCLDSEIEAGPCARISRSTQRLLSQLLGLPNMEVLQIWGEEWCQLSFQQQTRSRYHFVLTLGMSAVIFGYFNFPGLAMLCIFMLLAVAFRVLFLKVEGEIKMMSLKKV